MSKNDTLADVLIKEKMPKELKSAILSLCYATMLTWESMTEEEQDYWGTPQNFLGTQIMLTCQTILEE